MVLRVTVLEKIARLRADMRMGVPVVLSGNNVKALVLAAETTTAGRLADLRGISDDLVLAVTARRAETLHARAYDGDVARIELPRTADVRWVKAMADPSEDLNSPMKGPCISQREGSADLHRAAITICKQAHLLPAVLVLPLSGDAHFPDLNHLDLDEATPALDDYRHLHEVAVANLPLQVSESGRLHVFRPDDGGEEHYAIEIGQPPRGAPVLSRLHSACFTGDLMGSLKCDCGPQLRCALHQIGEEGQGVLLYLNQEGRGIGLANKMRAYSLQNQGFDTVQANHRLGFEDDERDFRIGAQILKSLGFDAVRLMTNNPAKIEMMQTCGITVTDRVPLKVGENRFNTDYLATKAAKSGHLL